MAAGRGVSRVLEKLQKSVNEGQFYEAHQMYRTLYFRYNAQKKYAEAIDLLYNGAITLLKHNQHTSGTDLAMLLVDTLEKSSSNPEYSLFEKLSEIHRLIDCDVPDRPNFVSVALRWSRLGNKELRSGHPELHRMFALTFWQEKNYVQARYHFLHSKDGEGCATMLVEYHISYGYSSEVDLFITQAVLQYLCLRQRGPAETALKSYTSLHPQVEKGPPYERPLFNFLWLLLLAVEGGKVPVFTVLCEKYQPSLIRDPTYNEYLDRIGQLFFGIPPPKPAGGGLFENLLSSLFSGMEDGDNSDEEGGASPRSSQRAVLNNMDLD